MIWILLWSLMGRLLAAGDGCSGPSQPDHRHCVSVPTASTALALPTAPAAPSLLVPWVSTSLPPRTRRKVLDAFPLAVDRLRELPGCRELFQDLGATGLDTLSRTIYYGTSLVQERSVCRGAVAFCVPNSHVIYLCRSFARLPAKQAALVLLHEALHSAGMLELPSYEAPVDACRVQWLVRKSCGWGKRGAGTLSPQPEAVARSRRTSA